MKDQRQSGYLCNLTKLPGKELRLYFSHCLRQIWDFERRMWQLQSALQGWLQLCPSASQCPPALIHITPTSSLSCSTGTGCCSGWSWRHVGSSLSPEYLGPLWSPGSKN